MSSFDFLWQLLEHHGVISEYYKADCARKWDEYSLEEQRFIYRSIRDKLRAGKFVNYHPLKAIIENAQRMHKKQQEQLSFADYYARFGTTEEQGGWRRVYLEKEQKTIYVSTMVRE